MPHRTRIAPRAGAAAPTVCPCRSAHSLFHENRRPAPLTHPRLPDILLPLRRNHLRHLDPAASRQNQYG